MNQYPKYLTDEHYISIADKDEILDFLLKEYQLDLTQYSEVSVRRRLTKILKDFGLRDVGSLMNFLRQKSNGRSIFLKSFTVNVTEMFRDPYFYRSLMERISALTSEKQYLKIWSAGCSSGEELLSLAILLYEHDLLDQCELVGSDINEDVIMQAREGAYQHRHVLNYHKAYLEAGGKYSLEHYYDTFDETAKFHKNLYRNITFQTNNFLEAPEGKYDLILCRNVLIYFNAFLQHTAISHLYESLEKGGLLALGTKESLVFYDNKQHFLKLDGENSIYKKIS